MGKLIDIEGLTTFWNKAKEYIDSNGIVVDTSMSDTSKNAVQNKVIKTYIDDICGDINDALDNIIGI